ncbi:MAG TPA: hypothetical protein VGV89_00890 [Thermoplasmata archaeon]|nr:hypothetical protein [Thermoplasmata archaeon]
MGAIVVVAVALLAYEYSKAALPPGVDPGHWLSVSYAYVGLPTSPDPGNQPFYYSPLMFPFLGTLVRLTGSPPAAATALALALMLGYGLTVMHLARRYVHLGWMQVTLVGLAMFSGTTFQMMFWGAYPNFLGFITFNETMIAFLLYLRTRRTRDGALLLVGACLTFLAHDLTFYVLIPVLVVSTIFLLLFGKLTVRFLLRPHNLVGAAILGGFVEGYGWVTSQFGISHPSYFYSNSSAYALDQVGEIFRPLGSAPDLFPSGTAVTLPPLLTTGLLLAIPLVLILTLLVLRNLRPRLLDTRLVIAAGWLSAVAAVPAVGYLARVETDYPRFLYFLPLPLALLLTLGIERTMLPMYLPQWFGSHRPTPPPGALGAGGYASTSAPPATIPAPPRGALGPGGTVTGPAPPLPRSRPPVAGGWLTAAVVVLLGAMFLTVTVPVANRQEAFGTAGAHDPSFVAAMSWLDANPTAGNVLTDSSAARWAEALTDREAYTVGPVWLLFDPGQIALTEESYWALNSYVAITDGQSVLSYSGFNTSLFEQAPLYSGYLDGIPFPVFRVLPQSIVLNVSGPAGTGQFPAMQSVRPVLAVPAGNGSTATITYTSPQAVVVEGGAVGPAGLARITFRIAPAAGVAVHGISFGIASPPGSAPELSRDRVGGIDYTGSALEWNVTGPLGQSPSPGEVNSTLTFSEPPSVQSTFANTTAVEWGASFADPNGTRPFTLGISVIAPGLSNPLSALPSPLPTPVFLGNHSIRFVLWPNTPYYQTQQNYLVSTFGFRPAYSNPEWAVLER